MSTAALGLPAPQQAPHFRPSFRQCRRSLHHARLIQIGEAGDSRSETAVRRGIAGLQEMQTRSAAMLNRLYIGGFSSGGHLAGVALVTDWQKEFGLPADMVKGALCMSGLYDMKPVRISKRSSYVKFTDEMEHTMSSVRYLNLLRAPVIVTHGTNETSEFQRQTRDFAAAVKAAGKPVELIVAPDYNHFEMGESLSNPYGPNGRAALALMKLAPV
jgi:arylformamidase